MNRRLFVKKSATAALLLLGIGLTSVSTLNISKKGGKTTRNTFQLNYAPHLGTFKKHAGGDPINQLNFTADQGFSALDGCI